MLLFIHSFIHSLPLSLTHSFNGRPDSCISSTGRMQCEQSPGLGIRRPEWHCLLETHIVILTGEMISCLGFINYSVKEWVRPETTLALRRGPQKLVVGSRGLFYHFLYLCEGLSFATIKSEKGKKGETRF